MDELDIFLWSQSVPSFIIKNIFSILEIPIIRKNQSQERLIFFIEILYLKSHATELFVQQYPD